jgi:hypothetical protein
MRGTVPDASPRPGSIPAWTIGANGVFVGSPDGGWRRLGRHDFSIASLVHSRGGILAGGGGGLWRIDPAAGSWIQLHDETLTEVLGIAAEGSPVASAYGLATGVPEMPWTASADDPPPPLRWRFHSDGLPPDGRFSNAVIRDPNDGDRWMAGTEAGVLVFSRAGASVERTGLAGFPVRALLADRERIWAGTDGHGVWGSADGILWSRMGTGLDEGTVYCLAPAEDGILLAGTLEGLFVGDGSGRWRPRGPGLPVVAAAAGDAWAIGAMPGGLWFSTDRGAGWRQSGEFTGVGALLSPGITGGGRE